MASRWIDSPGKRVVDIVVAGTGLLVLWPVILVVSVLVRWRLGSPVLFRQRRAGRQGVPIVVPKFRSMTDARDAQGELLSDEQRLTSFGARLRGSSLDELPQLWSVLRGEMSLVGPRPLPVAYIERYSADQVRRLEATPGITGWAQVNGRNATSWSERLAQDVWYVDHATPQLDLRILLRTVRAAVGRHGVSADGHVTMREFMGER